MSRFVSQREAEIFLVLLKEEKERGAQNYHAVPSLLLLSSFRTQERAKSLLNEIPEDASMQSVDPGFRHLSHRILSRVRSFLSLQLCKTS